VPIAAFTMRQPVQVHRVYSLAALVSGAAGTVVFGPGTQQRTYQGRFSTVQQGQLLVRCASTYAKGPVSALRVTGAPPIGGVVTLAAGNDVQIDTFTWQIQTPVGIAGAIGLALATPPVPPGASVPPTSPLYAYAGPCGARPESRTCPSTPLETIDGVGPDCAGILEIEFRRVHVYPVYAGVGGLVLSLPLGLSAICPASDWSLASSLLVSCGSVLAADSEPGPWYPSSL